VKEVLKKDSSLRFGDGPEEKKWYEVADEVHREDSEGLPWAWSRQNRELVIGEPGQYHQTMEDEDEDNTIHFDVIGRANGAHIVFWDTVELPEMQEIVRAIDRQMTLYDRADVWYRDFNDDAKTIPVKQLLNQHAQPTV